MQELDAGALRIVSGGNNCYEAAGEIVPAVLNAGVLGCATIASMIALGISTSENKLP